MKKSRVLAAMMVCLMMLAGSASAASRFAPADVQTARLAALECLKITAFQAKFNDAQGGRLTIWQEPIRIWVDGEPTSEDRDTLAKFIMSLAVHVPLLPNIRLVETAEEANITLYYGPAKKLADHVEDYASGNWGYFTFWFENNVRTRAQIGIATDRTTQKERNHLLMEELVGALGLSNDHELYTDSILYNVWTETQTLSDVDWLMLNMAYSPYAKPGMTYDELRGIYYPIITK